MRWTEHRKIAAQGCFATVAVGVAAILMKDHAVTFVAGLGTGVSLLMVLLCWKWRI